MSKEVCGHEVVIECLMESLVQRRNSLTCELNEATLKKEGISSMKIHEVPEK